MIFVTVGTTHFPFDRLIGAVESIPAGEEIVVQRGASLVSPANARVVDFMTFEELDDAVSRARVVVSHAGVGSIMVALAHGRRPIVTPRLREHGEAVDDHQRQVAELLAAQGRVVALHDVGELASAVSAAADLPEGEGLVLGPLVDAVAAEVRSAIDPRA
jgi:UDP-N-acetylglucosamine transferase subunit ALG13